MEICRTQSLADSGLNYYDSSIAAREAPAEDVIAVRASLGHDSVQDEVLEATALMQSLKFNDIFDKRVQDISYSAGYMILLIDGIIPDTPYAYQDEERFSEFRKPHKKQLEREVMDGKE